MHDLSLEAQDKPHILLFSKFPSHQEAEKLDSKPKNILISKDTTSLVKELEAILRKLPTEQVPSKDIYNRNIGIFWMGPDGYEWTNSAPQGCGAFEDGTAVTVTEDDKKAFNRAVEITEVLVKRGVAQEG